MSGKKILIYTCKYCTCWTRILRQDSEQSKPGSVTQNGTDVVDAFIYDWTEALQTRQVIIRVTFLNSLHHFLVLVFA